MPKSEKQKLKLLYIQKYLLEETDQEHKMSMPELLDHLAADDISAERKSVYSDIEYLKRFGLDVEFDKSRSDGGYYMASRDFELAECKLLVDAVASSRFITKNKSEELIRKIGGLVSRHEAVQLRRTVHTPDRIKSENERIYYEVDTIHEAIQLGKQISFQYMRLNAQKKRVPRRDGKIYQISPWALIWDSQNYYLIGFDAEADCIKHFRVDRMAKVSMLRNKRMGKEAFDAIRISDYSSKTFGMYHGEEDMVTLEFPEELLEVIVDRFGMDTYIEKIGGGNLRVRVKVAVSAQFFGWLAGIGPQLKLTSPDFVCENYKKHLRACLGEAQD